MGLQSRPVMPAGLLHLLCWVPGPAAGTLLPLHCQGQGVRGRPRGCLSEGGGQLHCVLAHDHPHGPHPGPSCANSHAEAEGDRDTAA